MKKIEKAMVEAIRSGKAWASGNTMVGSPTEYDWQTVHLHGNLIAFCRVGKEDGSLQTQVERFTFRRWPTRTTCSRLRALGVPASVKKGIAMIGDKPA